MIVYNIANAQPAGQSASTTMPSRPISAGCAVLLATTLAACDRGDASARAAQGVAAPRSPPRCECAAPQDVPIVLEAVGGAGLEGESRSARASAASCSSSCTGRTARQGRKAHRCFRSTRPPRDRARPSAGAARAGAGRARSRPGAGGAAHGPRPQARHQPEEFDDAVSRAEALGGDAAGSRGGQRAPGRAEPVVSRVTAPVSGVTGRLRAAPRAASSPPGRNRGLLTTLSPGPARLGALPASRSPDLAEAGRAAISPRAGQNVRLILPDESLYPLQGHLNFAATQIDSRMATQELRAEFDNPKRAPAAGAVRARAHHRGRAPQRLPRARSRPCRRTKKGASFSSSTPENKARSGRCRPAAGAAANWLVLNGPRCRRPRRSSTTCSSCVRAPGEPQPADGSRPPRRRPRDAK